MPLSSGGYRHDAQVDVQLRQSLTHQPACGVALGVEEPGVGDVGAGERSEDPCLTAHGLVGVLPLVGRRVPQDVRAPGSLEPNQDVLGAAGELLDRFERSVAEATVVHPGPESVEVDRQVGGVHGGESPT